MQGGGKADNIIEISPSNTQNYEIKSTHLAIVVIIDNLDSDDFVQPEADGKTSLRKMARGQNVLVARTGMERGLSAPISFQSLQGQTLPLERHDVIGDDIDVVRVSLETAVRFIVDLETREDSTNANDKVTSVDPGLVWGPPIGFETNREILDNSDSWADAYLASAETVGYDTQSTTWESVRRVQAGLVGEIFRPFDHWPFCNKSKVE